MIEYKLNIGDVVTSWQPASYTCYGLGSCIGLFIQDNVTGISGGAHILLPENEEETLGEMKFYSVPEALNEILKQFRTRGSNLTSLRAKVAGGANVIGVNTQMGKRNTESVVNELVARKIFIAALDVGGVCSRTAKFQGKTGKLTVRIPERNEFRIY